MLGAKQCRCSLQVALLSGQDESTQLAPAMLGIEVQAPECMLQGSILVTQRLAAHGQVVLELRLLRRLSALSPGNQSLVGRTSGHQVACPVERIGTLTCQDLPRFHACRSI